MNPILKLFLKLTLAIGSLSLVFFQIDLVQMASYLKELNIAYLITSALALAFAQVISAFRMQYYFETVGIKMSRHFAIALYWVGAFFNLVLPGGIGGDGYKVLLLAKLHNFSKMLALQRIVSGRASGLFLLILFTGITAYFSDAMHILPYAGWLITAGILLLFPCYFISIKLLLKEDIITALVAAKYSFVVQGLCMVSAYLMFASMGLKMGSGTVVADYLMLFMISSIVSVLPISIGGVGLRELTFLYGATYAQLDVERGIAFSLVYFVVNAFISLLGVYFFLKIDKIHGGDQSLEIKV